MTDKRLDKYPVGNNGMFQVVDTIAVPHTYCITPKHVAYASDHCGGILGKIAIEEAEKHGARCDICKGKLKYAEHETALLVEVNSDLPLADLKTELSAYLRSIKDMCVSDGFAEFAFKQGKA